MKNKWYSWILAIAVICTAYQAWAENITISTYYPSPYGSYTQLDAVTMTVSGNATVGGTASVTGALTAASLSTGTGAITGGAITGSTVSGTTSVSSGAAQMANGAISGTTVAATTSLTTGSMVIRATNTASGAANELQIVNKDGKYYCQATYKGSS